jgi:molybdopterin-guanine dinucleotide biosynthesis protein A
MVLVNGNHFTADTQIVVVDAKKPLEKKLDRINNPLLVIKMDAEEEIPNYLNAYLDNVPVLHWPDQQKIGAFIKNWLIARKPEIKGLVLAGGHSVRMKRDKGAIKYHGLTQRQYLYNQLSQMQFETLVSCREDQVETIEQELPLLPDSFRGLGPMGAILSAFREDPDSAWLVVACDLPYLSNKTIKFLVDNRDQSKIATAFQNPHDDFPEPLITIWEPRSYATIFNFLSQGYSCPRKVLINSDIKLLTAPDPKELSNVNHPEEYQVAVANLRSQSSDLKSGI